MPLRGYLRAAQGLLDSIPSITTYSISFDERSPYAAFLQGRVEFTDRSTLHFKEFVVAGPQVRKLKYGYQWSDRDGSLRFRYDNAADPDARDLATYPHHKHTPAGIGAAEEPTLASILSEIAKLLPRR